MELIRRPCRRPDSRPPVLFIHGAYADAKIWDVHFLDFFAEAGFNVWALSLRGHGKSRYQPIAWPPGFADYIDDVEWAIGQIGEPPVLVGHSMGGLVAQRVLKKNGISVKASVLIASVPPDGMMNPIIRLAQEHPLLFHKLGLINASPRWMWEHWVSMEEVRQMFFSKSTALQEVKRFYPLFQCEPPRALTDLTFFCPLAKMKPECPMLAMGGEEDIIIPPEFVQKTADFYSADIQMLPGLGHAMMLDKEWETAAKSIVNWLQHAI